jgi:hypothetical protein
MGIHANCDFGYGFSTEDFVSENDLDASELVQEIKMECEKLDIYCEAVVHGYLGDHEEIAVFLGNHYTWSVPTKPVTVEMSFKVKDSDSRKMDKICEIFLNVLKSRGIQDDDLPDLDPDWILVSTLVP